MLSNKIFIIAEAGVNHNGKLELALELCNAAKRSGADAVKFQTWKTELIVTLDASMAKYQEENIRNNVVSQFDMLKQLELSYADFSEIKAHCDKIGIQFLSTPDEEDSLEFLCDLGIPVIKVGSGEVTNIPFLKKIGYKGLPVILSTGMSDLGEVELACNTLRKAGVKDLTLLHCTSNYPCPMNEVNLNSMLTLQGAFKCPVGYSDHTVGIEIPIAASAMGAVVIEKHFTLDKNMEGPDHAASIDVDELTKMVKCIRNIEIALGDGIKRPNESEINISSFVRKSIVARMDIPVGTIFEESNIAIKRSNGGMSPVLWESVIGKVADRNYRRDDLIIL